MEIDRNVFANEKEYREMLELLEGWKADPLDMKAAFVRLGSDLSKKGHAVLSFKSRPGVSYSLRASVGAELKKKWPLFVMIDIIDDDSEGRWLSVCFYGDMITDPDEAGDLVPGGLLGEDGYCFDLDEYDESLVSYIVERIGEAHDFMQKP